MKVITKQKRRGFTLVELVVALAILAAVAAVIGTSFASGVLVWDRARSFDARRVDALLAIEELERDLRQSVPFQGIAFKGEEQELQFPGRVRYSANADGEHPEQMAEIVYSWDEERGLLLRRTHVAKGTVVPDPAEAVVTDVSALQFTYLGVSEDDPDSAAWGTSWSDVRQHAPSAVRISMIVGGSNRTDTVTRSIYLPRRSPVRDEEEAHDLPK